MKQTKNILKLLEEQYRNIDYYNLIVEKIESNVNENPDIAIESCKSLLEGLSKFIWKQIDISYDAAVVDKMDFQPIVKQSLNKLATLHEDIEIDFVNKVNKLIVSIGDVRNKRGDISHGRLSPKDYFSDVNFANLVMNITDNMLYYILLCFSKVATVKEIVYDDYPDFNDKLDTENDFGYLSYSKALFEQDPTAYELELQEFLDNKEIEQADE